MYKLVFPQTKLTLLRTSFGLPKTYPAFKAEPFITTYKDYISKINFELAYIKYPNQPIEPVLGSWEEINKKYNESEKFGKAITGNGS